MVWEITAITFLATVAIVAALLFAFLPDEIGVGHRLSQLLNTAPAIPQAGFIERQIDRIRQSLAYVGQLLPESRDKQSKDSLLMLRAGYRSPNAVLALNGAKLVIPPVLVALVYASGIYQLNPLVFFLLAGMGGYLLPEMWLLWRVRVRQHRLRLSLPDGLDLLVICVESGLGLDQALTRVAEELQVVHPELSSELQLVNLEMRVGKSRVEALRELGRRTGLEDVKALVAMLVQTERFGTSVGQSLRVHSDDLRTKRRQRAEEMAAKTSVKMVPALVFFIFPALMLVILGPAVILFITQLEPAMHR